MFSTLTLDFQLLNEVKIGNSWKTAKKKNNKENENTRGVPMSTLWLGKHVIVHSQLSKTWNPVHEHLKRSVSSSQTRNAKAALTY